MKSEGGLHFVPYMHQAAIAHIFSARTTLETSPRVHSKPIDLQRLYKIVLEQGGYDEVTRSRGSWRQIGLEFNLGINTAGAYAFTLKTVYYKNLA